MEENNNKQIDAFLKKQFKEIPLESPSKDFTANIMDNIVAYESVTITPYKPLISKKMWFVVAAAVIAIIIVPLQNNLEESWFSKVSLDLSFLEKVSISGAFDGLSIPTTAFYGMLLFTLMIFAQVFYVKGFFKPRTSIL